MGQNPNATRDNKAVADLVISNAVVIDHDKIIKCDIGVKNGYIMKLGKPATRILWMVSILLLVPRQM